MWFALLTLSFLLGSVPSSVLVVGRLLGKDVRGFGDGNPGAINAYKAGGLRYGLAVGLLDFLKGALPVGLAAQFLGWRDFRLATVAVSCLLGSAFSPWLGFRGGKSIACTFGVWTGVLMYEAPLFLGAFLALFVSVQENDAWSAVLGFLAFLVYLWLRGVGPWLIVVGIANALVLMVKHAGDLSGGVRPRRWLLRSVGGR